jgi:hypothetical protein
VTQGRTDGVSRFCSDCVVSRRVREKGLVYIFCLLYLGCLSALDGFQGSQKHRRIIIERDKTTKKTPVLRLRSCPVDL